MIDLLNCHGLYGVQYFFFKVAGIWCWKESDKETLAKMNCNEVSLEELREADRAWDCRSSSERRCTASTRQRGTPPPSWPGAVTPSSGLKTRNANIFIILPLCILYFLFRSDVIQTRRMAFQLYSVSALKISVTDQRLHLKSASLPTPRALVSTRWLWVLSQFYWPTEEGK